MDEEEGLEPGAWDAGSAAHREAAVSGPAVVGVAASPACLESLERFFATVRPGPDVAYVVVLHLHEAVDEGRLFEAVARAQGIEVAMAQDGMPVEAGRAYLAPSNTIVTIEGGVLRVRPATDTPGGRAVVDSFLLTLAEDRREWAVAVVLRGTGGHGTLGIAAFKEKGGLTIAEHESEALGEPADLADYVLPAESMPERIALYARHLAVVAETKRLQAALPHISASLTRIAGILQSRTGHDFHGYKQNTFVRRVQRRMQVLQLDAIEAYVQLLREDPDEVQNLFNDLLIGVTQFFRDKKEFERVETEVVPKLFEGKGNTGQVRVWVLGCATGEEAYSLAILLREYMAQLETAPQVQIFATDIDGRALAAARVGRYAASIAQDVRPDRLARWFVKEGDTYCVAKELRDMCIFSAHNIVRDPPFSRLDLVSCRNLLIYLKAELQDRILPLFHFALVPGGFLFVGTSENASRHAALFAPLDRRARIFRRRETERRVVPEFPAGVAPRQIPDNSGTPRARLVHHGKLARDAERIVERYAPAYVVTDAQFNVLHFSGRTGRYLDPSTGAASLNLVSLVNSDLRLDVRAALQRCADTGETVRAEKVQMSASGNRMLVDIVVEPMRDEAPGSRSFVVIFKDGAVLPGEPEAQPEDAFNLRDEQLCRLEAELRTTRDRLQATIEELESTNEELKSSNEEYQSLNEELQSANEELQTSKEETQSINEELTTVNAELAQRVHELGRTNSDLKNLLESTQIATVFLDNDLRVMNFTPAVTAVFHLVETDIGRPIAHIKSRLEIGPLQDDIRRVMRTLGNVEREIEDRVTGARHIVRVMPYRSIDNFIAGVVLTFVDVTPLTRAERALRESEARLRSLMEGLPQLVWRAVAVGSWGWSSPQWTAYTGLSEEASRGRGWLEALHPEDRAGTIAAWQQAGTTGVLEVDHRLRARDGGYRWFQTRAAPVRDDSGAIVDWVGASTDIDDLRRLQEEQKVLVAELQHRTRNLIGVVRSIANQTLERSDSLQAFRARFSDRLAALSRVQGLLSRSDRDPVTIRALVSMELDALGAEVVADRIVVDGPDVPLRSRTVQTMALAVHELATNARKYGSLATSDGQLSVTWEVRPGDGDGRHLALEWIERGLNRSREEGSPVRRGFGRELLERALPYQLGAQTSFELGDSELRCSIVLPLDPRPSEAPV